MSIQFFRLTEVALQISQIEEEVIDFLRLPSVLTTFFKEVTILERNRWNTDEKQGFPSSIYTLLQNQR